MRKIYIEWGGDSKHMSWLPVNLDISVLSPTSIAYCDRRARRLVGWRHQDVRRHGVEYVFAALRVAQENDPF